MKDKTIKDKARARRLKILFNLSVEDYEKILKYQQGVCYICQREPGKLRLSVDHCHKTGLIRGLLCMRCNKGIAYFEDKRERLYRGDNYLGAPPAVIAVGEKYGVLGRAKFKKKMVYGNSNLTN